MIQNLLNGTLPFLGGVEVLAQAPEGGLRPYWYIFLAYASAWIVVGGWLFSMARRLSRLEDRVGRGDT